MTGVGSSDVYVCVCVRVYDACKCGDVWEIRRKIARECRGRE